MAVFGWPDLGKLNRVTEEQRGVVASGKNARGPRPRWALWASRQGMGVMVRSMQESPLPGYRAPGPTPRGAECAQATASRGKAAQGTGLSERQRQVQPEGQRLRCLRHPQRGDQHAAIGREEIQTPTAHVKQGTLLASLSSYVNWGGHCPAGRLGRLKERRDTLFRQGSWETTPWQIPPNRKMGRILVSRSQGG